MQTPQFVNAVVAGACRLVLRGEATVTPDFGQPVQLSGEHTLEVTQQANVRIDGQLIAYFAGAGAFVVEKPHPVRVVTNGPACVNMTSPTDFHVGGKGVLYAEGVALRLDDAQAAIAVDCPFVHAHDESKLVAVGCGRVEAHNDASLAAFGAESLLIVERSTLAARDCREVFMDQGSGEDGADVPTVNHLVNCGTPQMVTFDPVAWTEDLGYHGTYVPVEGEPGTEHIAADPAESDGGAAEQLEAVTEEPPPVVDRTSVA